jgi:putative transposase
VISWELDQTLEIAFVLAAVQRALAQAQPAIWNSDQGSHFTSPQYLQRLQNAGLQISMDGRGRARDNIFTERLWRTIKYEEVYLHEYVTPKEAHRQLANYIYFYNFERPHQALDYQTPAQLYGTVIDCNLNKSFHLNSTLFQLVTAHGVTAVKRGQLAHL